MRLLNTSTFQFCEFHGSKVPYYAILSHTWGEEEVSFQDMQSGNGDEMTGFAKIKRCCALAASEGWEYVWIDTCCIDKTSSAELTEAINSMFEWYHAAEVCYAYLADVSSAEVDRYDFNSPFRQSRWFTRGWTLQELLAPATVVFLNQDWAEIGTKSSLAHVISAITRISRQDMIDFKNANIAMKMSWASLRETTRVEDTAYCLLGLFGVNMPLLYGEGRNAFIRLQLEILGKSDDETIFAWEGTSQMDTGLLAPSPAEFSKSGNIRQVLWDKDRLEYSMTNRGLRMELTLLQQDGSREWDMCLAPLNCARDPKGYPIAIFLKKVAAEKNSVGSKFIRCLSRQGASLITLPISQCPPADNLKQEYFIRVVNGSAYSYDPGHPSTSAGVVYSVRRSAVYVKQLNNAPGHNLVYRPRRFAIRYPPSLCYVSEVYIRSGLAGWQEGEEPGECAAWLDTADEVAAVIFKFSFAKNNRFMLLLRRLRDDSARVGLWPALRPIEHIEAWPLRDLLRLSSADRTSAGYLPKYSILAAVRPRVVSGEKQFLVDVSFGEPYDLRWYLPLEDQEAMYDNDQLEKLVDQIQAYTPLRPSSQI